MNKSTHFFFAAMFAFALALTLVQSRAFLTEGPVRSFYEASVYTEQYRPYGERLQDAAASQSAQITGNRQWFQGKVQDESTGLQYFGARYYDPAIGRFMGVDAAGFDEDNIQSFNHYAYANNNPYRYTDPDGNFAFLLVPIGWVVGGAAVGAITDGAINAVAQYATTGSIRMQGAGGVLDAMGEGAQIGAILGPVGGAERAAAKIAVTAGTGVAKRLPPIKAGSANGPTAGQRFPESIKDAAKAENPTATCVYCRIEGTAVQVDHAISRARGGNATLDNAQLACPHCNASKGAGEFPKTPSAGYRGPWPPEHW